MRLFSPVGTVFLCVGMIVLMFTSQSIGALMFASYQAWSTPPNMIPSVVIDGSAISVAMLFTLVAVSLTVIALVKWKIQRVSTASSFINEQSKNEQSINDHATQEKLVTLNYGVADYLAIKPFTLRIALGLIGIWLLFLISSETLTYLLDRNPTEFMDAIYATANPKWLLILVIVLVVPIYEELVFRGLLWSALSNQLSGKKGVWLAGIVTSVLFALIHIQYDIYEMSTIFVLALILSLARHKSGSLLLPILIHSINNGIAMWQYLTF